MKKVTVYLTVLALLALLAIPATGLAAKAGDFDLGGFVKLETFWDSTEMDKNLDLPALRRNAAQPNRVGRLKFTSQYSRFNFKIRGPEVFGAKTLGYLELDFNPPGDGRLSSTNSYTPRMRHAYFRMDWPGGWQLLMGQYYGVFTDFTMETINDTPYQNHGMADQRIPQIRMTYKTGPWNFSGLVGVNYDPSGDNVTNAYGTLIGSQANAVNTNSALIGQRSNFPQFQGEVTYEKDLWGKAAFYGRPRGFVANVAAGITRINYQGGLIGDNAFTWGRDQYQRIGTTTVAGVRVGTPLVNNSQTLVPWVVQSTLFIPVLTTTTQNLKNTASVTAQFYIGQGLSFIAAGRDADNSWFRYDNPAQRFVYIAGVPVPTTELQYRRHLTRKYGGYIQGQYYFNNQWYVTYIYGFAKPYGVSQARNAALPLLDAANIEGYEYASITDQTRMWQEHQVNLFYRPIKAFKFGLGYSFLQTDYFQITSGPGAFGAATNNSSSRITRTGENHSVRFAGWFYF